MILNERVAAADQQVKDVSEKLIQVVQQEYPVGSQWKVKAGNAIITVEVTGHNKFWWSSPGEMSGVNLVTGKKRNWMPSQVLERVYP